MIFSGAEKSAYSILTTHGQDSHGNKLIQQLGIISAFKQMCGKPVPMGMDRCSFCYCSFSYCIPESLLDGRRIHMMASNFFTDRIN